MYLHRVTFIFRSILTHLAVMHVGYKIAMMGICCDKCCYIFGDNQSMLVNFSMPDSMLRKKSNSVAYHFVREGTARDEWRCTYVKSEHNHSNLLTKIIPNGEKRMFHVRKILHWI